MLMGGGCRSGAGFAFPHCTAVLIPSQQERQLPPLAVRAELDISLHSPFQLLSCMYWGPADTLVSTEAE